jgi:DnaK suppressor protein
MEISMTKKTATKKTAIKVPSESAIKRMPVKDYMCDDMLLFFKSKLEALREDIIVDIANNREEIANLQGSTEVIDMAARQELMQQGLKRVERQTNLLNKIDAATKRIADGEYGYCEETGEPIGVERLLIRPTATLSVASKEQQEFQERTEGVSHIGHDDAPED